MVPWTHTPSAIRNGLRITTTTPTLDWAAIGTAVRAAAAADPLRLQEWRDKISTTGCTLDEAIDGAGEDLARLPHDSVFGYLHISLPNGRTEWQFNTTGGVGDDECGELMWLVADVFAWPEAAAAAGVVDILIY